MSPAPPPGDDHPSGVLVLLAAGGLGMVALGTVEVWSGRVSGHVDADSGVLLLLLGVAPIAVMAGAGLLVHRRAVRPGAPAAAVGGRAGRAAPVGRALLTVAAVLVLQAVLFGGSSALVQEIGCGRAGDDWCGFGSGVLGVVALTVGAAVGVIGAVLVLVSRRTAARG